MSTYNYFPSFDKLVYEVYNLKDLWFQSKILELAYLDSSYLRYPPSIRQVLPNLCRFNLQANPTNGVLATPNFETRLIGYSDIEVQKLKEFTIMLSRDEKDIMNIVETFTDFLVNTIKKRYKLCRNFSSLRISMDYVNIMLELEKQNILYYQHKGMI